MLTAYNGESITYDTIGNPLTYRGMTFTWSGRELSGASTNGKSYTYKYNADGLRTQKSVDGMTTYYIYSGDKLVAQKTGNNTIYLEYDSTGSPFLISYNGSHYYYILNGQGDVIALIDNTGNTVVEYTYDPWGQITSVTGTLAGTLGQANPLRYRGYYYDSETGLYYLQSRYYDPETGRFISADGLLSTGQGILGHNMFAYCGNNPVNRIDATGMFWKKCLKIIAGALLYPVLKNTISSNKEPDFHKVDKLISQSKDMEKNFQLARDDEGLLYNKQNRIYASKKIQEKLGPNTKREVEDISSEIFAHQFFADLLHPLKLLSGRIDPKLDVYGRLSTADIDEDEQRIKFFEIVEAIFEWEN